MSVGRNEICPCGSGKKYKKCCGIVTPIAEIRSMREQRLRKEYASWIERLNKYVAVHAPEEEVNQARERFARETGLSVQDCLSSEWNNHFLNWLVFDRQQAGMSLLDGFLKHDGRRMDAEAKEAFHQLHLRVCEVLGITGEQLTVRDLYSGQELEVIGFTAKAVQPGHILVGRLLYLGMRHLLFSGCLLLAPAVKQVFVNLLQDVEDKLEREALSVRIYRSALQNQSAPTAFAQQQEGLVQRVYEAVDIASIREILDTNTSFELKKQEPEQEIWVFASRKEEHLIKALDNTLLELHEVTGELIIQSDKLTIEGLADGLPYIEKILQLDECKAEKRVDRLSSTGKKLTKGTIFITSQPMMPPVVLQWAVQTYFAEKWLVTPHQELTNLAPILVAASDQPELRASLTQLVEKMEKESAIGQGMARFMRLDFIRPRLCMPNPTLHISNLLRRPLIEGLPESIFTVQPARLEQIAAFVRELTQGKSEATVKKYDETMNLFRSFVRCAFGPSFDWSSLRKEDVAYFMAHDVVERSDAPSKTLANNLLSVLSAFFKWLEKNGTEKIAAELQPILTACKEDLPEAYRLRLQLQKEASANLRNKESQLETVFEGQFVLKEQQENGWLLQDYTGQDFIWKLQTKVDIAVSPEWMISGLFARSAEGTLILCGTPELYPPAVAQLLGVQMSVPV